MYLMAPERHLPEGIWACPACPEGWWKYDINTDRNVCVKCGYSGGSPEKWRRLVEAVRQQTEKTD